MKKMSETWGSMSEMQKAVYHEKAKKASEAYELEMKEWEKKWNA